MSVFAKFKDIATAHKEMLETQGISYLDTCFDQILSPTEAVLNGKKVVLAGTNNYLGLTFDPECIQAASEALEGMGTGTTGSRLANGSYELHKALENELSQFYGYSATIIYSTGFQAVQGTISSLVDRNDLIFLDAHSHASIYDGALSSSAQVYKFKHNDPDDLEKRLQKVKDCKGNILICIEGIYSMLGDIASLREFVDLKHKYNAYLLVDEAHSLGVLGDKGCGLVEEVGVLDQVDFVLGTFSKSLGSVGGFCSSRHAELDYLRYACRQYIFTASQSPAQIASVRTALQKLQDNTQLRNRLWERAKQLYQGLKECGMELGPHPSPIVAIKMDSRQHALFFWQELLEKGVYANLVFPPATPDKRPLLRSSVNAAHTREQIEKICTEVSDIYINVQAKSATGNPAL